MFNQEFLLQVTGGDEELARDFAVNLSQNLPNDLAEIQSALKEGELEKTRRLAHRIKGAVATAGDEKLSKLAKRIESGTKDTDLPAEVDQLVKDCQRLIQELSAYGHQK